MKGLRAVALVCAFSGAVFFSYGGCGGTLTLPPFVLVRVELPGRDPLNIEIGQVVQFVLAGYDANFNRFPLRTDTFTITNVQGSPGTMEPNGRFTATGTGSGRAVATWPDNPVTALSFVVRPVQARISGVVRNESNSAGIPNVIVTFYDASNVETGRATTNANGNFLASVPTNTTKVNFDRSLMPPGWYAEWLYRGVRYTSSTWVPNCHAVIVLNQPLANGVTSTMPDPLFLAATTGPPPPPPNGCQ